MMSLSFIGVVSGALAATLFFLPSIVALTRRMVSLRDISIMNLFALFLVACAALIWQPLFWIVAGLWTAILIWAVLGTCRTKI
jgi:hypothetical protein